MTIIDHIQYLITCHDCVVVSGLGAFVSQYNPARISSDGLMLLPPSRLLVFNNVVSHDDGLLVGSVARRERISYEAAREEVEREVELLRHRIDMEGYVDLPRIGRLLKNEGALLTFVPVASDAIANMMYASLPSVRLDVPVIEDQPTEQAPVIVEVDTRRSVAGKLRGIAKYAAAVVVLFAVGTTLTTPVILNRPVDQASLSGPKIKAPVKMTAPVLASPVRAQAVIATDTVAEMEAETTVATTPEVVSVKEFGKYQPDDSYNHYIIVGSCASMKEAKRFIARKGGLSNLRVLPSDGRYRVYAAMANDYDAAFEFKSTDKNFKSHYPDAWVYTKK